MIYFLYLKIPIHHRHNFVTDIDPRLTHALPIREVRSTLLTLITMQQTILTVLCCGEFSYAPTGQQAHSTGQRPVKIAPNNSRPERAKAKRERKKTSVHQHAKTSFPPNFSSKTTVSEWGLPPSQTSDASRR
jgi:hypothetical protein